MAFYILKIEKHNIDNPTEPTYVMLFSTYENAFNHLNLLKQARITTGNDSKIFEIDLDKTHHYSGCIYQGEF